MASREQKNDSPTYAMPSEGPGKDSFTAGLLDLVLSWAVRGYVGLAGLPPSFGSGEDCPSTLHPPRTGSKPSAKAGQEAGRVLGSRQNRTDWSCYFHFHDCPSEAFPDKGEVGGGEKRAAERKEDREEEEREKEEEEKDGPQRGRECEETEREERGETEREKGEKERPWA